MVEVWRCKVERQHDQLEAEINGGRMIDITRLMRHIVVGHPCVTVTNSRSAQCMMLDVGESPELLTKIKSVKGHLLMPTLDVKRPVPLFIEIIHLDKVWSHGALARSAIRIMPFYRPVSVSGPMIPLECSVHCVE